MVIKTRTRNDRRYVESANQEGTFRLCSIVWRSPVGKQVFTAGAAVLLKLALRLTRRALRGSQDVGSSLGGRNDDDDLGG